MVRTSSSSISFYHKSLVLLSIGDFCYFIVSQVVSINKVLIAMCEYIKNGCPRLDGPQHHVGGKIQVDESTVLHSFCVRSKHKNWPYPCQPEVIPAPGVRAETKLV